MFDLRLFGNEIGEIVRNEDGRKHKFKVDEIYPFFVKCHDEVGRVECFNLGDLISMGAFKTNYERYSNPYNKYD